jgi:hypothetical protein
MALVVELIAGEVGSRHGVKLGDRVVVTSDGCRVLCPVPVRCGAPRVTNGS